MRPHEPTALLNGSIFQIYRRMASQPTQLDEVTIRFAGDSGDGMQLTGMQFTQTTALFGNDLSTFPDYPAEIRAPQGTIAGVSGYQIHFGSKPIHNPGDVCDVLVVMNAAALRANLKHLKPGGTLIANKDGFDNKNLRLAGLDDARNPLTDGTVESYQVFEIDITKMTREALKESGLGTKEIDRSKNMFVLGLLYWLYNRPMENTIQELKSKFVKKPDIAEANIKVLNAGWAYGETAELFPNRYQIAPAKLKPGRYRGIMGNQATAIGLVAASQKARLPLFLGSYPITPASDILHELSKYKNFDVRTFQAEDEIAGITSAIGAAYGGHLGVTTSSGPGVALKTEALGLAFMLELPLVVCNIQRGGPSTGLPTKTEQADLLQALYGRNGETPIPVVAPCTPSDCFTMVFEAARIALEHMTPVFFLSDAYLANGSEPWRFPAPDDLPEIKVQFAKQDAEGGRHKPYQRNNDLVRQWAIPGTPGLEHRIGGIEKEDVTGNISYDPLNHERMVKTRAEKVKRIALNIPLQTVDQGPESGKLLLLSWGGTYGIIKAAVADLLEEGYQVAHVHLRYLNPFPRNLGEILCKYEKVLVPELNNGQLIKVIRDQFLVPAQGLNKIQGQPFTTTEIKDKVREVLKELNSVNA